MSESTQEFRCPECGRSFGRAQALGAHRMRKHGVPGKQRAAYANGAPTFATITETPPTAETWSELSVPELNEALALLARLEGMLTETLGRDVRVNVRIRG